MYTFITNDRNYEDWHLLNTNNEHVKINIDPLQLKVFNNDIINLQHKIVKSPTRITNLIPGILQINNQTYGRYKKKLLYKCYPNDPSLPIFLIPYQDKKPTFEKGNNNRFILFRYEEWNDKHPIGKITQNFGSVDNFEAYCKYQLFRYNINVDKSIQFSKSLIHKMECVPIQNIAIEISRKFGMDNRMHYSNIFSIDPAGCTDIDDAIGVRTTPKGHMVSIYIANVPAWIEFLEQWDNIPNKTSTIYLPHEKLLMLPIILTEKMCSLTKNEYKPSFVLDLYIERNQIVRTEFKSAIIRVKHNYVYEEKELLQNVDYVDLLLITRNLSKKIPIINEINDSHDVVSFYMILMNSIAAKQLKDMKTGIFRNKRIKRMKDNNLSTEEKQFIESWTGESAGYSLYHNMTTHDLIMNGIDCYTHITSPIRRIVDLINMTIIQQFLNLIEFGTSANIYIKQRMKNINNINENMKNISKIQADCSLLYYIQTNEFNKHEPLSGVIIEKEVINSQWEYTIFIQKIKFVTKITTDQDLNKYGVYNFTIHTFVDENNLRKKIRLHLI